MVGLAGGGGEGGREGGMRCKGECLIISSGSPCHKIAQYTPFHQRPFGT